MKAAKQFSRQVGTAAKTLHGLTKRMGNAGRSAIAGAAGAAVVLGNLGKSIHDKAATIKNQTFTSHNKSSGEVFTMKKSTFVALLVALAAVAGVLGALYFYVLRREKELDEYEQLLFSEDFNDDFMEEEPEAEPAPAPAPEKADKKVKD